MPSARPPAPPSRPLAGLLCLLLLGLALGRPAGARAQPFQGFFAGTSADGGIFLARSHLDLSSSTLVRLSGVTVPGAALSAFQRYCSAVLAGRLLLVRAVGSQGPSPFIQAFSGEITVLAGSRRIHFNKQALVDGYALLQRQDPRYAPWGRFEEAGRRRRVGVWSAGPPIWSIPEIPRDPAGPAVAGTDRDRIVARYGLPDHSHRTTVPHRADLRAFTLYQTDVYLREGKVFIYRDGVLLDEPQAGAGP